MLGRKIDHLLAEDRRHGDDSIHFPAGQRFECRLQRLPRADRDRLYLQAEPARAGADAFHEQLSERIVRISERRNAAHGTAPRLLQSIHLGHS
jgi:hypothetical protein